MTDFEDQNTITPKGELFSDKTNYQKSSQAPNINGVPLQDLYEKKVRSPQKAGPYTFRRPSYLRYIEYS